MSAISLLTVKAKVPLFKKDEAANAIELIQLEEVGFECVSQKDLYNIGDQVYFVMPDYCLTDNSLFDTYIRPGGDIKKSKLGSNNRVRAIKFGLHRGDGINVYSQGILLPVSEVDSFLIGKIGFGETMNEDKVAEKLGIFKYEEPEPSAMKTGKGGTYKPLPSGVYKTDETNIENLWTRMKWPILLYGTVKVDGSSITLYYINGKAGICSRTCDKDLVVRRKVGKRDKTWLEKLMFWRKPDLNMYQVAPSDDTFVTVGKPYLDAFVRYCTAHNLSNIVLRGELCGKGLKGSGNPKNPHTKLEPQIIFYGVDEYVNGVARKKPVQVVYPDKEVFYEEIASQGFKMADLVFPIRQFNNKEELMAVCNEYFANNMVEGIVVRNESSSFSAKVMNLKYDAEK